MASNRPLTRTRRTMRRMGPLAREVQEIQNELVKLARRLDRLQVHVQDADAAMAFEEAERRRLQPETEALLAQENVKHAVKVMRGRGMEGLR